MLIASRIRLTPPETPWLTWLRNRHLKAFATRRPFLARGTGGLGRPKYLDHYRVLDVREGINHEGMNSLQVQGPPQVA